VVVRLVPHIGEFDFAALLKRRLGYEECVFQTLRTRLPRYDAVLEIGANVGVYTVFFAAETARLGRPVPIYAFEPSRLAYVRLLENIEENRLTTVTPFNVAVSDEPGFLAFFEPTGHLTNGSLYQSFAGIFTPSVVRTMVPSVGCKEIERLARAHESILLKLDVEGAEAMVLNELAPFVKDKRPEIVLEVLALQADALNDVAFLRDSYDLFLMTDAGLINKEAFEGDDRFRDYLLVPRTRAS
jgi:FkbM family methyltransferase